MPIPMPLSSRSQWQFQRAGAAHYQPLGVFLDGLTAELGKAGPGARDVRLVQGGGQFPRSTPEDHVHALVLFGKFLVRPPLANRNEQTTQDDQQTARDQD